MTYYITVSHLAHFRRIMKIPDPRKSRGKNTLINDMGQKAYRVKDDPLDDVLRVYARLRHYVTGQLDAKDIRWIFSVKGGGESHTCIQADLRELELQGLVTYEIIRRGKQFVYHITVEDIPEDVLVNAPKSAEAKADQLTIMGAFRKEELRAQLSPQAGTMVDYSLAKKLLSNTSVDLILQCIKEYWNIAPAYRVGSNFKEFYARFGDMLNRVQMDVQENIARKRELNKTVKTAREYLEEEIERMERVGENTEEQRKLLERV